TRPDFALAPCLLTESAPFQNAAHPHQVRSGNGKQNRALAWPLSVSRFDQFALAGGTSQLRGVEQGTAVAEINDTVIRDDGQVEAVGQYPCLLQQFEAFA